VAGEQDATAKALPKKMASFLAKAPAFTVTMRSGYAAMQADGQVIEFGYCYLEVNERVPNKGEFF
jgi:hypothetical protein